MDAAGACAGCPSPPGRLHHPQDADLGIAEVEDARKRLAGLKRQ